jgi:ankyrin repeat protein
LHGIVNGETPLMVAAMCARTDILTLLLRAPNIKVNIRDKEKGWTALFYAAEIGSEECVLMLLKAGANRKAMDAQGRYAADVAIESKRGTIAALIQHDPSTIHAHDVCAYEDAAAVKSLLKQGCPVNYRDDRAGKHRQTLLMTACSGGKEQTVKLLLEQPGAIPDIIDDTDTLGQTALMKAARVGALEITALLLCAGADRNLRDASGCTATDHAAKHSYTTMFQYMGQLLIHKQL